MPLYMNQQILS